MLPVFALRRRTHRILRMASDVSSSARRTQARSTSVTSRDESPLTPLSELEAQEFPLSKQRARAAHTPGPTARRMRGISPPNDEDQTVISKPESSEPQTDRRTHKRRRRSTVSLVPVSAHDRDGNPPIDLGSDSSSPKPRKRKNKKNITEDIVPTKRQRRPIRTESAVYNIEPVEQKETTFRGRLGYACINTVLRALKPDPVFCSRTCRIDTIQKNGINFVKELALQNVRDLATLIQWNEENQIQFMRMSSDLFPFAAHPTYGYDIDFAAAELKAVGELANRLHHRLTFHPGQFVQIASPKEHVVENSVRELSYHAKVMELMDLGPDSVIVIHMGGVYGDKASAISRFRQNYQSRLSSQIKARLVLENDEICYNLDDLMPVCEELDIPIVIDYHHNWINPSTRPLRDLIPLVNTTWERKGIRPKQHLSSPRPGARTVTEKRAHADRCTTLPPELPDDMDLMVEAKDKEQAVFHLYRIYGLARVAHENLRPEKRPALEMAGRVE